MNKKMALIAVILCVVTALFLVSTTSGTEGAVPAGYAVVSDADTVCYTDSTLPGTKLYITSPTIADSAFRGCTTISEVSLTDGVKNVGDSAFEGCTSLVYFRSPGAVSIGDCSFKNTGKVTFEFSSALKSVGANAFENCKGRGPYLMGTEVTELKSGTFSGSSVKFEDLRGVTRIASDAFSGTLVGQIVDRNQTVKLSGVPEITIENAHITGMIATALTSVPGSYKLYFITEGADVVLNFTDSGGTTTLTSAYNTYGYNCEYIFNNIGLRVEGAAWTIHFPADSGIGDAVHVSGEGTYTIPSPTLASSLFKSWNIRGETGTRTRITESEFAHLDPDIYLESTYNTMTVTYDHSALPDSSGLPRSGTFAVGDSYPTLPDIAGYSFSGWSVGSKFYAGGDRITTYRDHTAVSIWDADTFSVTIVSQGSVVATKTVAANSVLALSELSVAVPESKVLMGWSTQENGRVLTSDPVIDRSCSIYAVFGEKAKHTVRYLDGQTVLGSVSVYDGSILTIGRENPTKDGMSFQNWELGDTGIRYYRGDSLSVKGDIDLKAVWLSVQHTVKYVLDRAYTSTYDHGTEIVIGTDRAVKDGFELLGWALTSTGDVRYRDGDRVVLREDLMLFPVWKEGSGSSSAAAPSGAQDTAPSDDQAETETPAVQGHVLRLMDGSDEFRKYTVEGNGFSLTEAETPERTGYKFIGWSETANAEMPRYTSSGFVPVDSDTALYAVWEKLLAVTYHDDTDTFSDVVYCERNETVVLMVIERAGYVFLGWSEHGSTEVLRGAFTVTRDIELYPQWEPIGTEDTAPPSDTGPEVPAMTPADQGDAAYPPAETSSGGDDVPGALLVVIAVSIAAVTALVLFVQHRRA